ncbi:hypothetical protein HDU97_001083 [Phlyctochytrium planicorne]|nr:hypothetical protein HDU97_001083 [Phlyctochytrium planicorne]
MASATAPVVIPNPPHANASSPSPAIAAAINFGSNRSPSNSPPNTPPVTASFPNHSSAASTPASSSSSSSKKLKQKRTRPLNAKEESYMANPGEFTNFAFAFKLQIVDFTSLHTFLFACRSALDSLAKMHPLLRSRVVMVPIPEMIQKTIEASPNPVVGGVAGESSGSSPTGSTTAPNSSPYTTLPKDAFGNPLDSLSRRNASKFRLCFEELPAKHPLSLIPIRVITLDEENDSTSPSTASSASPSSASPSSSSPSSSSSPPSSTPTSSYNLASHNETFHTTHPKAQKSATTLLDAAMEQYLSEEMSTPMALARGPLARLTVVVKGGESRVKECRIVFALAHAAFDGKAGIEIVKRFTALLFGFPIRPIETKKQEKLALESAVSDAKTAADVAAAAAAAALTTPPSTPSPPPSRPGTPSSMAPSAAPSYPHPGTPPSTPTYYYSQSVRRQTSTPSLPPSSTTSGAYDAIVPWGPLAVPCAIIPTDLEGRWDFIKSLMREGVWMRSVSPLAAVSVERAKKIYSHHARSRYMTLRLSQKETDYIVQRAKGCGVSVTSLLAGAMGVAVAMFVEDAERVITKHVKEDDGLGPASVLLESSVSSQRIQASFPSDLSVPVMAGLAVDTRPYLHLPPDLDGAYNSNLMLAHRSVRVIPRPKGFELFHEVTVQARAAHLDLMGRIARKEMLFMQPTGKVEGWKFGAFASPSLVGLVKAKPGAGPNGKKPEDERKPKRPFFVHGVDREDDPESVAVEAARVATMGLGGTEKTGMFGGGFGNALGSMFGSGSGNSGSLSSKGSQERLGKMSSNEKLDSAVAKKPVKKVEEAEPLLPPVKVNRSLPIAYTLSNLGVYNIAPTASATRRLRHKKSWEVVDVWANGAAAQASVTDDEEDEDEENIGGDGSGEWKGRVVKDVILTSTVREAQHPTNIHVSVVTVDGQMHVTFGFLEGWVDGGVVESIRERVWGGLVGGMKV